MNGMEKILENVPTDKMKKYTVTENLFCKRCGRKYELYQFEDGTELKFGCECEMIAKGIEERERMKQNNRIRKANDVFSKSLINKKIKNANFDNYEPTNESLLKAKMTCEKYVRVFDMDDPKSLYLHGTFGTGKTHLAYSITDALRKKGYTALFMNVTQLITLIRSSYNKDSTTSEIEIMRLINDVDFMVFDDLGVNMNDYGLSKLFEMIDSRIGKPNLYTTNLTAKEISSSKEWQRIFSRIADDAYFIEMNGDDYRLRGLK